ncbi:hypothetical protein [Nocardioides sp. Soil777]|uniref:hypothetical protein n=1 Tax=Nocardioides sp. Soil777 TaxID=1736409 RepID=UPI000B1F9F9F|nr:hypothetical protein [Nocardioides sp. Soil777]
MARKHGFRIYTMQAFRDRKKGRDAADVSQTSSARDEILQLLEQIHDAGTHFLEPRIAPKPGDPEKPVETITFGEPTVVRQDLIHFVASIGETGSHHRATRRGKKAKNLKNWSPEAQHFMTLVFPRDEGDDTFLLVGETIKSSDAVRQCVRVLTKQGLVNKKAATADQDGARKAMREQGTKPPKKAVFSRLVFDRKQAADNNFLTEILQQADSAEAIFESRELPARGGGREFVRRRLAIRLVDESDRNAGAKTGKGWNRRRQRGETMTLAEGVSDLAEALIDQDLLAEGEEAGYQRASISVRNKNGMSTNIAVDTLRDVFTYPVSDGRPPVVHYYDKVAPRVKEVAAQAGVEITQIVASEVAECLEDD